ncbi:MAG: O-antigen ligase family protein, partial [Bacteroidota bacterium]
IYGAALAFVLPMLILFWWHWRSFGINFSNRFLLGALTILIFVGELMAFSRAAWLSLVAVGGLAILMRFKVRPSFIFAMVVVTSLGLYLFQEPIMMRLQENESISNKGNVTEHIGSVTNLESDASNLERLNRWFCAWQMFLDKPLQGFGPGTYQFQYGPYQTSTSKTYISTNYGDRGNAHSEYLTYLSEQGLPGFLIFIIWVGYTIALGMRLVYRTRDPVARYLAFGALLGLCTFFFHGLFNTFIDQDKMAGLVFPAMALLVVLDIRWRSEQEKSQTPLSGSDLPLQ